MVNRASTKILLPPSSRLTWDEKLEEKNHFGAIKLKEKELEDGRKRARESEKTRLEEKRRRKEENELKSTTYQVASISDPHSQLLFRLSF